VEDRRARFEHLYETCSPDIAMYALRRTDRETAQDIVAETFTIAWRRFDDVPEEPLPWLYGVARRVLANQRRSSRRLTALRRKLAPDADTAPELADPKLGAAFRELLEIDREILMLVAWEGLTPSEAAVVLGCTSTAARLRLHRARNRLANALGLSSSDIAPEHVIEEVS
jgi:RNA polymerase sigma-70 factor (ECF subfamily)